MTRPRAPRYPAILVLVVLSIVSRAQQPPPPPLVRSTSRLVLLDVIVTDRAGTPIRTLTENDFTIFENGVPQKIISFEPAGAAAEAAKTSSVGSSPGTVSARNAPALTGPRTIILLDQLNTSFADLAYARDSILRFLDQQFAENQPIALMSVELPGLVVVQDYTLDRSALRQKLIQLTAVNANSKGNMDVDWAAEYAQAALGDLTQIARASVGAPCGVNVIWVSSGFAGLMPFGKTNDQLDAGLRRVTNLLIRSRMRLYTIDPAGVVAKVPMNGLVIPTNVAGPNVRDPLAASGERVINSAGNQAADANVLLSRMTHLMGGLSYYGRNDVAKALGQAVLDGSSAYAISYSPANTEFKGEYRKIEIRSSMEDAIARTRPGYYAIDDEAAVDKQVTEARLDTAMQSSLTYSGVDVSCPATFDSQKERLTGKIVVSPRPLFATSDTREQVLRISSFSKNGKALNVWSWRVNWKDPWTNRVVSASFDKVLAPKAAKVRFLVSDPTAERIGTCEYKLR